MLALTIVSATAHATAAPEPAPPPTQAGSSRDADASSTTSLPVGAEARRLYEIGLRAFNVGEYDLAIDSWKASYQQSPAPGLLYNLAQAHRLRGDCAEARLLYKRYLASGPTGRQRERAEARVVELESCAQRPPAPPAVPAAVAPGPPVPRAAVPVPAVTSGKAPALRARERSRLPVMVLGGLSLGLGAATGYFGWQAVRAADETSRHFTEERPWTPAAAEREATGRRSEKLTIVTGTATVLAAAATLWLLLRD